MIQESIGPTPYLEDCQQVGMPEYDHSAARAECRQFLTLLEQAYPPPPGCDLQIVSNPHDAGTYLDVVAVVDESTGDNAAAHTWLDEIVHSPGTWAELSKLALHKMTPADPGASPAAPNSLWVDTDTGDSLDFVSTRQLW